MLIALLVPGVAIACPPAVTLVGDPALVAALIDVLQERGIAIDQACSPTRAEVTRQADGAIVVRVADTERVVAELATAATVIESFTRDVDAPLLAAREPHLAVLRPPAPAPAGAPPAPAGPHGIHVFGGPEGMAGSDGTAWMGMHAGACVVVGTVCIALRARSSSLLGGGVEQRQSWELLLGIDVPFTLGGVMISPGFGAGPSGMATRTSDDTSFNTNGVRGSAHATVSFPIAARVAIDVHLAANLLQRVADERMAGVPVEPWAFVRFGVGLRYGACR